MTQTPRKALKTLAHIVVVIGLYLVFSISLGLGLQVSPLYGNIGLGVTGVLVALYVYLGICQRKIAVASAARVRRLLSR